MGKLNLTARIVTKTLIEVLLDILRYYLSNYPVLLILGVFRRIKLRLKCLWIPKSRGRPPISNEIIDLILEMKRSNWGWGSLRISQELALLGIKVSKTKVAQILRENGLVPPKTKVTPISWHAFYHHHKHIWAIDFTSIFDRPGNQLFVFSILDVASRKLASINISTNPDKFWVLQQFRNASMQSDQLPDFVVSDNDGIFGQWLKVELKEVFGIQLKKIPPKRPWLNPFVERFQQSRQNVDVVINLEKKSLKLVSKDYTDSPIDPVLSSLIKKKVLKPQSWLKWGGVMNQQRSQTSGPVERTEPMLKSTLRCCDQCSSPLAAD